MCFGLMLGPKSTYLHRTLTYQGTCRAVGFWTICISFFSSLFLPPPPPSHRRNPELNPGAYSVKEEPCGVNDNEGLFHASMGVVGIIYWPGDVAQMSAVCPSISLASHSPRSVLIVVFFTCVEAVEGGLCR